MGLGPSYQKYENVLECGSGKAFLRSCISEYSGSVAHRGKIYLETILYHRSLHQNMYLTFVLRNTVAIFTPVYAQNSPAYCELSRSLAQTVVTNTTGLFKCPHIQSKTRGHAVVLSASSYPI